MMVYELLLLLLLLSLLLWLLLLLLWLMLFCCLLLLCCRGRGEGGAQRQKATLQPVSCSVAFGFWLFGFSFSALGLHLGI